MKYRDIVNRCALILGVALVLSCKVATAGLVAYWPFDGDPSDKVGHRVALLHGGTRYEPGYLGQAVRLHGRPDGVELPVGGLIGTLSDCTFALWVNPTDKDSAWSRVFSFGRDPAVDMYLTGNAVPPNALQLFIGNGKPHRWMPASSALGQGWHHVAVVIDARQQRCTIYLDGVAVALESDLPPSLIPSGLGSTTENWLGHSPYAQGSYFNGAIDELAIFEHALTESEVRLLCQSSAVPFLDKDAGARVKALEQATWSLINDEPERAKILLREQAAQYEANARKLSGMSPSTIEAPLGALYALLAESHAACGEPAEGVVKLLVQSMRLAARGELYAQSLVSLFQYVPREKYAVLVLQSLEANTPTPHHLAGIARTFHASRRWDAFEAFLAIMLEHSTEPGAFAAAAQAALEGTGWSARLETCLAAAPRLGGYSAAQRAQHAQRLMQEQRYSEAQAIYRDLLDASSVPAQRERYESELVQCAFLQGRYAEAVTMMDAFLGRYPMMPVGQMKKALLVKASALLGQRRIDDAIQACLQAIRLPSETQDDLEAHYLIGYCQMLQGHTDQARETFDSLVTARPGSPPAGRSRLLVERMGHASP